ncbi:isopentenyl-diphosphate Delta-isomerase [Agromyces humatus]|uniref:Isopentenyl-diphosphate Delta-isomerase n=1 Tax=Agromyces humatus TaxID=279573 RepID=A0ABP4WWK5_9MICO|nr:isopentenyl-diphosphate Delta-isomerase [Agromyces humatus]
MTSSEIEEVVLLDAQDRPVGRAPKSSVHGADTARHLAFSCHVFNEHGHLLVTRRALTKQAWPGVWTNSFCGHPAPAETLVHAIRRRGEFELGLELTDIDPVLPFFHYRATDASGVVENELCPVYTARTSSTPVPHPGEVMECWWVDPADLADAIRTAPWAFSPWLVLQAHLLPFLGGTLDRAQGGARMGAPGSDRDEGGAREEHGALAS